MSKYNKLNASQRHKAKKSGALELSTLIDANEKILWQGKPKKSAFILNRLASTIIPLLFFIFIVVLVFTFSGMGTLFIDLYKEYKTTSPDELIPILPMILFTIVPILLLLFFLSVFIVWPIASAVGVWAHTEYAVTDKRIIINSGFISLSYKSIFYKEINDVQLHRGVIDRLAGVGDIILSLSSGAITTPVTGSSGVISAATIGAASSGFIDISDYKDVYIMLKKVIVDIQNDIEFPNALRPEENPGYNTKYTGLDNK